MKYRWAPSLGEFEDSPEEIWGVTPYDPEGTEPCVFCGLYGLPDFYALWRYKGYKYLWWAGSDIRHFVNGYWLDDKGIIRMTARPLATWINKNCEVYVENTVEQKVLQRFGIGTSVIPSFLGDVNKFPPQKIRKDKERYYSSVSGNDFDLYGWDRINKIAEYNPDTEYHLYGNTIAWKAPKNVIVHGRVPSEQMNEEVKTMTGAIRMVEFEGVSEIVVKAGLWGQEVLSLIEYPHCRIIDKNSLQISQKGDIIKFREWLLANLNDYPWNKYAKRNIHKNKTYME